MTAKSGSESFNTEGPSKDVAREVDTLLRSLSLEEKVYMMSGHGFYEKFFGEDNRTFGLRPYQAGGGNDRLGLPPITFTDGPRGVRLNGKTTCFPVSMARGASWDVDLERRIGEAIGVESRALGIAMSGAICINVLRHPAWGRAQETYGEDPYHLGEMGAALCQGIQHHNVIATVKHFAANSIENSRFKVDVRMNERTLREVYLPHFKRVIDAGCGSVMSAYNKVNGYYCGHNQHLLRDILKDEWGFKGFVHSDWVKGVHGPDAAEAGLDIENPEAIYFGSKLVSAVAAGTVSESAINNAVRRILTTQLHFQNQDDPQDYSEDDVCCQTHIRLAQEAAEKSMVLLQNDGVLPLDVCRVRKLAVIGRLANIENLGDHGSSRVTPPHVTTLLEGVTAFLADQANVVFDNGDDLARALELAEGADAVILVAGYTFEDEGEFIPGNEAMEGLDSKDVMESRGGDRVNLRLRPADIAMIRALGAAHSNCIVALMGGSAIMIDEWLEDVSAVIMTWYPGMEGGTAFARLLFGAANPSGKLPFSIPGSIDHLPHFDRNADEIEYGLFHGYSKLERDGHVPAFHFGFGLSYTQFQLENFKLTVIDGTASIDVTIKNTGRISGAEIIQVYVGPDHSAVDRAPKLLRAFERVELMPGEIYAATFEIRKSDLAYYDEVAGVWRVEDVPYTVKIGTCSASAERNPLPLLWK